MQYVPHSTDFGSRVVMLDLSDLPNINKVPGIERYSKFSIKTFGKISGVSSGSHGWDLIFGPVNSFFRTLDTRESEVIAMMLLTIHRQLIEQSPSFNQANTISIIQGFGELIVQADKEINLCELIKRHVQKHIPLGDFSNAGKRAQDKPQYTFHAHEAESLLAVVMLCKILAPLFGAIVATIDTNRVLDSHLKESYTVSILHPIFQHRYADLINKLDRYIAHTFHVAFSTVFQNSEPSILTGSSENTLVVRQRAAVYVKNLVNMDLYRKEGGNVVAYICDVTRRAVQSKRSTPSGQGGTSIRLTPDQMNAEERGGGDSVIEVNSISSFHRGDVPIIANAFQKIHINRILDEHMLDAKVHRDMVNYYLSHPFPISKLNQAVTNTLFNECLGGIEVIKMMKFVDYIPLVAASQLLAFMRSWPVLGHMLTAVRSSIAKTTQTDTDSHILFSYKTPYEFLNCLTRFSSTSVKVWSTCIDAIITEEVVGVNWLYNTADIIWESAGVEEHPNGEPIPLKREFPVELAAFIELTL